MKRFKSKVLLVCILTLLLGTADYANAGSGYWIEIGGSDDIPYYDNCYNAKTIGDEEYLPFDTTLATFDGHGYCMESPNLWYTYTATKTGNVTVSLCYPDFDDFNDSKDFDTKLAVYRGGNCPPSQSDLIECNDDFCGLQSEITFAANAGSQYLIEVGGFSEMTGSGVISIRSEGVPPTKALDLGDAPDSTNNFSAIMAAYPKGGPLGVRAGYPTVFNDGSGQGPYGPVHLNPLAVAHLGSTITNEAEADIGIDQDAVNNIVPLGKLSDLDQGDDSVIFPFNLPHCHWTTFDYFVNVINPGTNLWVNVWCDWNRDGDWDDTLACSSHPAPEWAVQNQYLFNPAAGLHRITSKAFLPNHPNNTPEEIWMRLTLSERPWTGGSNPGTKGNGGSGPQTGYEYGETEDYYFTPKTSYTACEDFNGDGVINLEDLGAFTADWLESCP
ncbi:MAG: GEVED domain-containing protein [Planctomycetota bacterium]